MEEFKNETNESVASTFTTTRRRLLAFGALTGTLACLGPKIGWVASAEAATPPSKPTGQIVIGFSQEPTVFMPLLAHIEVDEGVYFNLFSTLWRVDEKGNFQPDLVAEVPTLDNGGISDDGLSWRLKLNQKAKWHDGTPFTADDVKYNIELIQNPKFLAMRRAGIDVIDDIKVLGPSELSFKLTKPYAPLSSILAWTFLVPKHLLEKASDINKPDAFLANPVGTGPFKWVERVPGDHITLSANEDYHGTGPYVEKLVFKYIPDGTVLYTQFQAGAIDYVGIGGIAANHYAEAKEIPGLYVAPTLTPYLEQIAFNLGKPIFQDRAVREALYLAMDKQSIIEQIYYGLPPATESFLPEGSWAFDPNLPKHVYDPEKAKKILDDAGWKAGADGVREKNGSRLEFSISTTAGSASREQVQQFLQQGWADIGARMTIQNFPAAVMWGDYWNMSKFDTVLVGIGYMVGPDPDATQYFSSKGIPAKGGAGSNVFQYENPEADKLLAEGASIVDIAKRKAVYSNLQELIREELPILPIYQTLMVQGTKSGLQGFVPNVNVMENCWNANTWYWAS
ncbi:MAG: peptide ABC transporter substrate-binding protein [Mesorhizobium sp.]|nr:MAG: peptide ABC transporter substrate-binding protein [Mesorhizobium sp.]